MSLKPVIPCHHFKDKKIIFSRTDKLFCKIYYKEVVKMKAATLGLGAVVAAWPKIRKGNHRKSKKSQESE